jgi:hypothetical protein
MVEKSVRKNYKKKTWNGRVTRTVYGSKDMPGIWIHCNLENDPERPVSVYADLETVHDLILDAVLNDGPSRLGVFSGDLTKRGRIWKLRVLTHMGVPEDVAREITGLPKD